MAAAEYDEEDGKLDTPYLPERYHQIVKAKKQRRLKKRLLVAVAALLIIAILFLALAWAGGIFHGIPVPHLPQAKPDTHLQPQGTGPSLSNTTNKTDTFTRGPGLSTSLPSGVVPLGTAISALITDYPAAYYSITSADLTNNGSRPLYKFGIEPVNPAGAPLLVDIDAASGNPYSPGEEAAKILREEALHRALAKFPALHPDRTLLTYSSTPDAGKQWTISLFVGSTKRGTVILDADTGEIISFAGTIPADNRPATPAIDAVQAQKIADQYIIDQNRGELPLNMSISRYDPLASQAGPVAGQYTFIYERTFQDFPTDVDGFTVIVDSVTGDVTGYTHQWTTPEHAFSASSQPEIVKQEATFAVMQKAKELYPADVGGLQIISAELRWKNKIPYGTVARPGSIPLGWKVVFDDDAIRANASAQPAVAWVDAQSGDFIAFDYWH